jgi:hypothetical protein
MSGAQVKPLLKTGGRTPDPAIPSWLRMLPVEQRSRGSSWRGSHRGETCRPARLSRCSARSRDHPKAPSQRETPRRSRHPPQPADDSPSRYSRRRDTNRAQERPASRMPRTQPTQQQTRTNVPCRLRAQDASQRRDTTNVRCPLPGILADFAGAPEPITSIKQAVGPLYFTRRSYRHPAW